MEPRFTAALFLGERSPYGLSVARAIFMSRIQVLRVLIPSERAYAAAAERLGRTSRERSLGPKELIRKALARSRRLLAAGSTGGDVSGKPIRPVVLDPGATAEQLEARSTAAGVVWQRVDEVRSDGLAQELRSLAPSLLLCAAFPLIFPRRLLRLPPRGCVNFHPSLLPRCRGCHPIFWTLASGEREGGVTAHYMTSEVDAGDILAQIPLPLSGEDDYGSLYARAMAASRPLVQQVEEFIMSGGPGRPQNHDRATYFHEDTEEDHLIAWSSRSAGQILDLIRTREAFTLARGDRLGVLEAEQAPAGISQPAVGTSRPGCVIGVEREGVVVAASAGALTIKRVAWRGRLHGAADLARALGLRQGEVLG